MAAVAGDPHALGRRRLIAEALLLFAVAPVVMAVAVPPRWLFPVLAAFSALGLVLLWHSGGFDWRGLVRGWRRVPWGEALALGLGTLVVGSALVWTLAGPDALFHFARTRPELLAMVWCLYPLLSALPQELVYRALFFHRYAPILPPRPARVWLNAAAFSLAHLMYWSPLVLALTFLGGLAFARAYVRHGFPAAFVLHAVAGNVVFLTGMGLWFYSGNVVRPF